MPSFRVVLTLLAAAEMVRGRVAALPAPTNRCDDVNAVLDMLDMTTEPNAQRVAPAIFTPGEDDDPKKRNATQVKSLLCEPAITDVIPVKEDNKKPKTKKQAKKEARQQARAYVKEAKEQLKNAQHLSATDKLNHYNRALGFCKLALELAPNLISAQDICARTHLEFAKLPESIYAQNNDLETSEQLCSKILVKNLIHFSALKTRSAVNVLLAAKNSDPGQIKKYSYHAISYATECIAQNDQDADCFYSRAKARIFLARVQYHFQVQTTLADAKKDFEAAIKLAPDNPEIISDYHSAFPPPSQPEKNATNNASSNSSTTTNLLLTLAVGAGVAAIANPATKNCFRYIRKHATKQVDDKHNEVAGIASANSAAAGDMKGDAQLAPPPRADAKGPPGGPAIFQFRS